MMASVAKTQTSVSKDSTASKTSKKNSVISSLFVPEEDKFIDELEEQLLFSKTALVNPSEEKFDLLLKQLRNRISESLGECIYAVGESDVDIESGISHEELVKSKATLHDLAEAINCDCTFLRQRVADKGIVEEYLVRRRHNEHDFLEVKVAVVGNVDAGKSTLLGVLTHCELDNGRGYSRQKLFRHKHEIVSGRTSSVGNEILGFSSDGKIINKPNSHAGHIDWSSICRKSSKVVTFIDLAGHERYLKTTVFGMTGHIPDFCMLMIGSNAGIIGTTKEHLGLALALNVPVFVVVTKIDMCPPNILQETMKLLIKILKSPGCRKIPVLVSNEDDAIVTATNFTSERVCPIFQISNVTGQNIELLKTFLNLLSCQMRFDDKELPEFLIDDTFSVPGVGTVVSGTVTKGIVHSGSSMLLGPDLLGKFETAQIKSIHRKRMPVQHVKAGQTAAFALKKVRRSNIRKGMVIVHPKLNPKAVWEFKADVLVLHHPTTISIKYQAMVHCGSVRQTACILNMSKEHLRTGDKAAVHFRYLKNPEYLKVGAKFVFREGRTKAVGTITELIEDAPAYQSHLRNSRITKMRPNESRQSSSNAENPSATSRKAGRH